MRWNLKLSDGSIQKVELISMNAGVYEFQVGEKKVTLSYPLSFPYNLTTMEVGLSLEKWSEQEWRAIHGNQVIVVEPLRHEGASNPSQNQIKTQMPGRILRIPIKVGDSVTPGHTLIVMEAMKMENEIRSTKAARVSALHVKEGMGVESGTVLVELEDVT